jgi:hypothetical protein
MSMIGLAIAGMGATFGAWVLHRRRVETWRSLQPQPRQRPRGATIHAPMVIGTTNPRELAANGIRLWQLHDGGSGCEFGQTMRGRRLRAEDTIALPAPGCGRIDCRCIYQPVREARAGERRIASNDRRDMLRFDASERRRNERRIRRNGWNEGAQI